MNFAIYPVIFVNNHAGFSGPTLPSFRVHIMNFKYPKITEGYPVSSLKKIEMSFVPNPYWEHWFHEIED